MQGKVSSVYFYGYITWNVSKDPEKVKRREHHWQDLSFMRVSKIETEPYRDTGPKPEPLIRQVARET